MEFIPSVDISKVYIFYIEAKFFVLNPQPVKKERVIAYVDGFNLYSGMKDMGFRYLLWLDLEKLIANLLKPHQQLISVKYFTSLINYDLGKRERQRVYIDALETLPNTTVFLGSFLKLKHCCNVCGEVYFTDGEKMTDVNIATQIVADLYEDKFDTAFIVSGDTDLIPPMRTTREQFQKRVVVAFPPNRKNDHVCRNCDGFLIIGRKSFKESQLEEIIENKYGDELARPNKWKAKTD